VLARYLERMMATMAPAADRGAGRTGA
jgi:hypothetical protein